MDDVRAVRRKAAVEAALATARSLGITVDAPRVLKDSNNTVIHLLPSPVVAKVGTSHFRDAELEALDRELAVASYLAAHEAPIVRPSSDVPPGPHRAGGFTVTLWRHYEPVGTPTEALGLLGPLLRVVHRTLRYYPRPLPSFAVELEDVGRFLADRHRLAALSDEDHSFLQKVWTEVAPAVSGLAVGKQPLHGSPHTGNWLVTASGPLLLDFETACRGPLEWDLSAMPEEDVANFPSVDVNVLGLLRRFRSLCVAVKCWIEPNRAPELTEAAAIHLRLLRGEPLD